MWGLESWGTLIWGGGPSVPLLGPLGLAALVVSFLAGGIALRTKRRARWSAALLTGGILLGSLAAIASVTLPHTFTNGTIADADEVNANFDAIAGDFSKWSIELDDTVPAGTSVEIPDSVLTQLCADDDGCKVRLVLIDWDAPNGRLAPIPEQLLFYQPAIDYLRINDSFLTDGDGNVQQLMIAFSQCYLTDGEYSPGLPTTDGPGIHLMKWQNYPQFSRCRITLID